MRAMLIFVLASIIAACAAQQQGVVSTGAHDPYMRQAPPPMVEPQPKVATD